MVWFLGSSECTLTDISLNVPLCLNVVPQLAAFSSHQQAFGIIFDWTFDHWIDRGHLNWLVFGIIHTFSIGLGLLEGNSRSLMLVCFIYSVYSILMCIWSHGRRAAEFRWCYGRNTLSDDATKTIMFDSLYSVLWRPCLCPFKCISYLIIVAKGIKLASSWKVMLLFQQFSGDCRL